MIGAGLRRWPRIASARGSGQIGKAPVSKTGDSRFESWLPRISFHREGWSHHLGRLASAAAGRDPGPDRLLIAGER